MARRKGTKKKSTKARRAGNSRSTTIVRSSTTKPIIIKQPAAVAPRRRGGGGVRRRRGSGGFFGGTGGQIPLKTKGEFALYGSIIGYVKEQKASSYNQIPTMGKLPREAVLGMGLHFFGGKNKHVDRAAVSALTIAGYEIGKAGFELKGWDDDD